MPNRDIHINGTLSTAFPLEIFLLIKDFSIDKKIDLLISLKRLGIAGSFAVIGVLLPDILEPASNPGHRKFFHSLLLAGLLITFFVMLNKKIITIENDDVRRIINYLGIGYGVHLLQDSTTKKKLPLV